MNHAQAEELQEALPSIPDDVEALAREAGIESETGRVDGSVISPEEQLLELVRTKARYKVVRLEDAAEVRPG